MPTTGGPKGPEIGDDQAKPGEAMGSSEDEDPGPSDAPQCLAGRSPGQSITVSVVAYVNLTRQLGSVSRRPVPDLTPNPTTHEGPVILRTTMGGSTIAEYQARVAHNQRFNADDDETGIIDVLIRVNVGAAIQLVSTARGSTL
jgi:hypothetical protein